MGTGARGEARGAPDARSSGVFQKSTGPDGAFEQLVMQVLRRRLSAINAGVLFEHAVGVAHQRCEAGELTQGALVDAILQSSPTFMPEGERRRLASDLRELLEAPPTRERTSRNDSIVCVRSEADLKETRHRVREMCDKHSVESFAAQKALAIASELARNIARYAGSGEIRVSMNPVRRTLEIRADDAGQGIADLEGVLRHGGLLRRGGGSGLYGVKQLADEFHIESGASGTHVKVKLVDL